MAHAHNQTLNLRAPFPSAPYKHSIWGFYIKRSNGQFMFQNFAANYSAKHFIDFMISDKPFKWMNEEVLITDDDIEIRCEQGPAFQEIIEYEYKSKEADWEIPEPYKTTWLKFKLGRAPKQVETQGTVTGRMTRSEAKRINKDLERGEHMNGEGERKRAEKKQRTPRPSKDGLVTIGDIAAELKVDPRDARKVLRSKKVEKPDAGWAWSADEAEKIKTIVKAGVK